MAKKQSFVMHDMWGDIIENLSDEQAGVLIKAIYRFKRTGEASVEDPVLSAVFAMIRNKMCEDAEKYHKRVKANQENGKRGGRPKTENNPVGFSETEPNPKKHDTDTDTDTDTVTDTVTDNDSEYIKPVKPARESIPYQHIVDEYNSICVSFPKVTEINDTRRTNIRERYKKYGEDKIIDVFRRAEASDWLSGRTQGRRWCGFDWLMRASNFLNITEGKYDNYGKSPPEPDIFADEYF